MRLILLSSDHGESRKALRTTLSHLVWIISEESRVSTYHSIGNGPKEEGLEVAFAGR